MPRTASGLSTDELQELARVGAGQALMQLRAEIVAVERTLPELALPRRRLALERALSKAGRKSRTMSAAASKAVSRRMKRYWAERRRAKAKGK
jgi:hypothetical protein